MVAVCILFRVSSFVWPGSARPFFYSVGYKMPTQRSEAERSERRAVKSQRGKGGSRYYSVALFPFAALPSVVPNRPERSGAKRSVVVGSQGFLICLWACVAYCCHAAQSGVAVRYNLISCFTIGKCSLSLFSGIIVVGDRVPPVAHLRGRSRPPAVFAYGGGLGV